MTLHPSITRRRAIATIGGASLATLLAACGSDSKSSDLPTTTGQPGSTSTSGSPGSTATTVDDASCIAIPQETAGPFPGDGSNGPNVLNLDGVVRKDIRTSFGDLSGTADGIELNVELTLTDAQDGCTPLEGAAVYLWHADAQGRYSLYSDGATDQNYLRGVQVTDASGKVSFTSVLPGCYDGRWPHIHFAVYTDVASATSGGTPRSTSQLAFPQATCAEAYTDARYPTSAASLARVSLESDNVFGDDGAVHQLATMSGSPTSGYTATLNVPA
jgi:protocatechuate 3,4-dioxygenase beta subunit